VRRYNSEASISLGTELDRLLLCTRDAGLTSMLNAARRDILSATRAKELSISEMPLPDGTRQLVQREGMITIGLDQ
jgi:hypothetical protein